MHFFGYIRFKALFFFFFLFCEFLRITWRNLEKCVLFLGKKIQHFFKINLKKKKKHWVEAPNDKELKKKVKLAFTFFLP